jgi:hypothetical protein
MGVPVSGWAWAPLNTAPEEDRRVSFASHSRASGSEPLLLGIRIGIGIEPERPSIPMPIPIPIPTAKGGLDGDSPHYFARMRLFLG